MQRRIEMVVQEHCHDEGDIALAVELASSSEHLRLAQRLDGELG